MLGCSTREDVLKLYGQPNDSFEATYGGYRLTYEIDDPLDPASWKIGFDDSGILDDVMVHHQAYFRSDERHGICTSYQSSFKAKKTACPNDPYLGHRDRRFSFF